MAGLDSLYDRARACATCQRGKCWAFFIAPDRRHHIESGPVIEPPPIKGQGSRT